MTVGAHSVQMKSQMTHKKTTREKAFYLFPQGGWKKDPWTTKALDQRALYVATFAEAAWQRETVWMHLCHCIHTHAHAEATAGITADVVY